jgi:hypothetical protein
MDQDSSTKNPETESKLTEPMIGPVLADFNNIEAPIPRNSPEENESQDSEKPSGRPSKSNQNKNSSKTNGRMQEEPLYPTPEEFQVKVFVINLDGNWSDCGVGVLMFLDNYQIAVCTDGNDQTGKDFMEDYRAEALRDNIGKSSEPLLGIDRGEVILKVDLREAKDFMKSQSKHFLNKNSFSSIFLSWNY